MNLRRPNQGVITQAIPGFYPDRMGVISLNWSNTVVNNYSPAGLYNNAADGSSLVVWSAEGQIQPTGATPATFDPTLLFAVGPNAAKSTLLRCVGALSNHINGTTLFPNPVPPGTSGDQLLITEIAWGPLLGNPTPPAGWTLINTGQYSINTENQSYYKWSNGAEPDHYDWPFSGSTWVSAVTAAYQGVDPTTPIYLSDNRDNVSNAAATAPITFAVPGCMAVATYGYDLGASSISSTPAGMTVRGSPDSSLLCDILLTGTGIAAQTLAFSSSAHWADTIFGIRPSQRTFTLAAAQPLIAGFRAPWGQSIALAQGAAAFGTPYYRAPCASGVPTTSAGRWQWPHEYPFAVLAPGQALLVNLTQVSSASLSLIYEVTKYY